MFRVGWLVGSPCSPRDSQESSPAPQCESIHSSVLSLLYGQTLRSIHGSGKNYSFGYKDGLLSTRWCLFLLLRQFSSSNHVRSLCYLVFVAQWHECFRFTWIPVAFARESLSLSPNLPAKMTSWYRLASVREECPFQICAVLLEFHSWWGTLRSKEFAEDEELRPCP